VATFKGSADYLIQIQLMELLETRMTFKEGKRYLESTLLLCLKYQSSGLFFPGTLKIAALFC
jgi:hypothetical protein